MSSAIGDFSRKIIHIDADAFYASVEIRENPNYIGKPIAVGGSVSKRGVIAASSYEARAYGVRSAMSSGKAMELCPKLLIVPPRFNLYRSVSKEMHDIFRNYTQLIEPLSLDEAYLDVSEAMYFDGSATRIAVDIRSKVRDLLGITVSAGIAPNKFLAKVASDWNKPDNQFTITPEEVSDFVLDLPVKKINGVGHVTAKKLAEIGVRKCGDLQKIEITDLVKRFGKYGHRLATLAIGLDNRPVQASRQRKSISVERTYPEDLSNHSDIEHAMNKIVEELDMRFRVVKEDYFPNKRFIKIRFSDFFQTTHEQAIPSGREKWLDLSIFRQLLHQGLKRRDRPVRLLGAGFGLLPTLVCEEDQLTLFSHQE